MRVVGGEARGRKFLAPEVEAVRPTADRVREAMFDVLGSLGGLVDLQVLDLFAGSGALGIEALSRGARRVTFVDQDREVVKTIGRNLVAVGLEDAMRSKIVHTDAIAYCRTHREQPDEHVDVAFCDPPYSFVSWSKLLAVIPGELLVLESSKPLDLPAHLDLHRVYRYGGTLVTVAHRRGAVGLGRDETASREGPR